VKLNHLQQCSEITALSAQRRQRTWIRRKAEQPRRRYEVGVWWPAMPVGSPAVDKYVCGDESTTTASLGRSLAQCSGGNVARLRQRTEIAGNFFEA
jgi:hypothetical protein